MGSVAGQYVVDNEQKRGKYRRFGPSGQITGLVMVERDVTPLTEELPVLDLQKEDKIEDKIHNEPVILPFESLKATYFVPQISKDGKDSLNDVTDEQGLRLNIGYVGSSVVKKHIEANERFTATPNNKVVEITIERISPEYSGLKTLADIDTILGFSTHMAEKPHSNSKKY